MKKLSLTFFIALFAGIYAFTQTAGQLDFNVTTISNGATFSPKHVLAIWVETESGSFVKTLKLRANARKQYLYTWIASSSQNTTDAVTGATLTSHTTHNISWDGTNTSGNLVDDGNYKVIIEYTSEHAQGPLASFGFNKSGSQVSLTPSNETYFQDISLSFTPEGSNNISSLLSNLESSLQLYPNPVANELNLDFNLHQAEKDMRISLYDINMRLIKEYFHGEAASGSNHFRIHLNSEKIVPGNYFIVISNQRALVAKAVIIQ